MRVTVDISNDLKVVAGDEIRVKGSRMRNAVPPPTTEEVQEEDTRRELNSGRIALIFPRYRPSGGFH